MFSSIFKKTSPLDALISPEYLAKITERHQREPHWGTGGELYADRIIASIKVIGAKSFLDYGCGKCALLMELDNAKELLDVDCALAGYDPAIDGFTDMPLAADMVACLNVLEHVEPDKIRPVLDHLASVTKVAALIAIDKGINHPNFWIDLLREYFIIGHVQIAGDTIIIEAAPWSNNMREDLVKQLKLETLKADKPTPIAFSVTLGKFKRGE